MKLTITADEHAKYREAQRLLGEINAGMRERDMPVTFAVTIANGVLLADADGDLLAGGQPFVRVVVAGGGG